MIMKFWDLQEFFHHLFVGPAAYSQLLHALFSTCNMVLSRLSPYIDKFIGDNIKMDLREIGTSGGLL
jgi:class 3 adenylate cyclase